MRYLFFTIIAITFLCACNKPEVISPRFSVEEFSYNGSVNAKSILVDASRDGGVWWFPQSSSTGFSSSNDHQGKGLANYLRSLGFKVDELPRGAAITSDILNKYDNVIRAVGFGGYSISEIAAYKSFLTGNKSLLLLQDHLTNSINDQLSVELGLNFEGAYSGTLNSFSPHTITTGITSLPYIAGSVIFNPDPAKINVLGTLTANGTNAAAMGIVIHPTSRIFFIGDMNGIEAVPQPFTSNLAGWLFR